MKLNRGTLLLALASLVVIIAMLLLSGQPASAPTSTPTPTGEGAGPLFPEIADTTAQAGIVRFEVVNNSDSSKVVMTKDDAGVWTVVEATNAQQLATDQTKAINAMSQLASLNAAERFTAENLADFGLDAPTYTLTLTDKDGKTYVVRIGNKASASPRYYALVNDDMTTVYFVQATTVDGLTRNITQPAYVPSPTPSPSPTATPNPYSEVEQTATAQAEMQNFFATLTATAAAPEGTAEATAEATSETASEASAEATPEATTSP
jgi:asparagine N-glycosylation enzyme membrane subunit Stt3